MRSLPLRRSGGGHLHCKLSHGALFQVLLLPANHVGLEGKDSLLALPQALLERTHGDAWRLRLPLQVEKTEYIRKNCNYSGEPRLHFFPCQVGFFSYLLCPQTPQLLLQSCPQLHLQALPLLAGGLELGQSTLQSLHFLHVSPLPPQLVLKLTTTAPCRLQSLLEPLRPGVLLLSRDSQALQLPLNPIPLNVLLLI